MRRLRGHIASWRGLQAASQLSSHPLCPVPGLGAPISARGRGPARATRKPFLLLLPPFLPRPPATHLRLVVCARVSGVSRPARPGPAPASPQADWPARSPAPRPGLGPAECSASPCARRAPSGSRSRAEPPARVSTRVRARGEGGSLGPVAGLQSRAVRWGSDRHVGAAGSRPGGRPQAGIPSLDQIFAGSRFSRSLGGSKRDGPLIRKVSSPHPAPRLKRCLPLSIL